MSTYKGQWGFLFDYISTQYLTGLAVEFTAKVIAAGPVPQHIAFCMDGNRRFAKKNHLELGNGHLAGLATLLSLLNACQRLGIKAVTAYAFSLENFSRPPKESKILFDLIRNNLWDIVTGQESKSQDLRWRIRFLGNRTLLDADIIARLEQIEEMTAECGGMTVNICCPYTSRDDIVHAINTLVAKQAEDSSPRFESALYTHDSGPLDILIRSSGETRLSDFMCWEVTDKDCRVEFIDTLWPDFGVTELYLIILKWAFARVTSSTAPIQVQDMKPHPPIISVSDRKAIRKE